MGRQEGPALRISLRTVTPYITLISICLLVIQLAAPCFLYIRCRDSLPTLSYSAALYGFDRWFMWTLVVVSGGWTVLVLGLCPVLSAVWQYASIWTVCGISLSPLLWSIGVFDQEQGARFLRQGQVHEVLSFTSFLLFSVMLVLGIEATGRLPLSIKERNSLCRLQKLLYAFIGLGLFTALESKLAYSAYAGGLWSEPLEALSEWASLLSAALIPYVWSHAVPEIHLELGSV